MRGLYKLDENRNPIQVEATPEAIAEWALWSANPSNRRVGDTLISPDDARVSTVFLGTDLSIFSNGRPILYETYVFGGPLDGHVWRYSSWHEAESGHAAVVAICQSAQKGQQ